MVLYCPSPSSEEFKELKAIFGEDLAYSLWDKNKGNPLDLAPNGEASILFKSLLDIYNNREDALKEKAKVYYSEFRKNFGDWLKTKKVYQGISGITDDRKINYFTTDREEARDYGDVRNVTIDVTGFLNAKEDSIVYDELTKEFYKNTGSRFDILDNSTKGLKVQNEFFNFLENRGHKGVDFTEYSDSQYLISFSPESNISNKVDENGEPLVDTYKEQIKKVLHPDPIVQAKMEKYGPGVITNWNNPYGWAFEKEYGLIKEWKYVDGIKTKVYNHFNWNKANGIALKIRAEGGLTRVVPIDYKRKNKILYKVEAGKDIGVSGTTKQIIYKEPQGQFRLASSQDTEKVNEILKYAGEKNQNAITTLGWLHKNFHEVFQKRQDLEFVYNLIQHNKHKLTRIPLLALEEKEFKQKIEEPGFENIEITSMCYVDKQGIIINKSFIDEHQYLPEVVVEDLLHEILHAFTMRTLNNPTNLIETKFRDKIIRLYKYADKEFNKGVDLSRGDEKQYGFLDEHEFISVFMTESSFANQFKNMPYGTKTVWERIIETIANFLYDISHGFFDRKTQEKTVYDEVHNTVINFIEKGDRFNEPYFNAAGYRVARTDIKKAFYGIQAGDPKSIANAFDDIAKQFKYNPEEHTFLHKKSKVLFTPVNEFMKQFGKSRAIDKTRKYNKISVAIRRTVEGNIKNMAADILEETGLEMNNNAQEELAKVLKDLRGESVEVRSNVLIADVDKQIADIVDLVLIDSWGRIRLFDFQISYTDSGFEFYNKPFKGFNVSNKKRGHIKLSIDKHIVEKAFKVRVFDMNIVMLNTTVNEADIITDIELAGEYDESGVDTFTEHDESLRIYGEKPIEFSKRAMRGKLEDEYDSYSEQIIRLDPKLLKEGEVSTRIDDLDVLLEKMEKHFRKRIEMLKGSYSRRREFQEFYEVLMEQSTVNQSFIEIIKFSARNVDKLWKEYQKIVDGKENFTVETLSRWKDMLIAYEDLNELKNLALGNKDVIKDPAILHLLKDTIDKKDQLKGLFETEGKYLIAKWLTPYYDGIKTTFKEKAIKDYRRKTVRLKKKGYSKEEIVKKIGTQDKYVEMSFQDELTQSGRSLEEETYQLLFKELTVASRDVNEMIRWVDNMLDTADPVAAAMVNAFVETDRKQHVESINKRAEVLEETRLLEKERNKGKFTTEQDFYSFALEFEHGKPTGYLQKPWKSSLIEEERNLAKILSKDYTKDEVKAQLTEWRRINTPLRTEEFNKAQEAFWYESMEKKKMTKEDYKNLAKNLYNRNLPITDLVHNEIISEEIGDMVMSWIIENRRFYIDFSSKWINPQWNKFMKDIGVDTTLSMYEQDKQLKKSKHPLARFYNFINELAIDADSKIPYSYRVGYHLPGIAKSDAERTKEVLAGQYSATTQLKETIKADFIVRPEDTERGNKEYTDELGNVKQFLPIHYTAKLEPENQSYDLAGIYYKFWESSNDYANKREILPEMEMTKFFIENRRAVKTSFVGRMLTKIKYQGDEDDDFATKEVALKEKTNLADQFRDWFEMAVYGKRSKEGTLWQIKDNLTIDVSKFVDALNRYTSLNLLSFNMVQGVANVLIGETTQAIDALAGEYVTTKDLTQATFLYNRWLPGMLGDVGLRAPQHVGSMLIEEFNILHEEPSWVSMSKVSRAGQMLDMSSLFMIQKAGEHWMQGRFFFAMLNKKKAYDKDGNLLGSMIKQYYSKNGKLVLNSKVDLNKSQWTKKDQAAFQRKVKGILSRIHGEYSDLGRVAIQRLALGRMAYMFRKFVVPGMKRRWGRKKYIQRLDQTVEGNYITTGHFIKELYNDLRKLKFALMTEDWSVLSDHEKANIKRTIGEVVWVLGSTILASFLYNLRGDDDEEGDFMYSYWAYQMYRLQTELLFFTPKVDEAMSIFRSPMASMSVIENIIKLTGQMFNPGQRYTRGPNKGRLKMERTLINFVPVYKQYYKMRDIEEQIEWFR